MCTKCKTAILFLLMAFVASCSKETVTEKQNSNVSVNYSIMLIPAESTSLLKSETSISGAKVSISVDGKTTTATTDANGQANFTNLRSGTILVKISAENYTSATLIVDLGSNTQYESSQRYASSIVTLFATSGTGTKTISGMVYAQTDVTIAFNVGSQNSSSYTESTDLETAPEGTEIFAIMNPTDFKKYVNTTGNGAVTSLSYDNINYRTKVASNGSYSITVPNVERGMNYSILGAYLETKIKYSAINYLSDGSIETDALKNWKLYTKYETHLFKAAQVDGYVMGNNIIKNITYTCTEGIYDANYKGSIY